MQPDPSLRMSVFETLKLIESIKDVHKVKIEPLDVNKLKFEGKPVEPIAPSIPTIIPQSIAAK